jgi:Domain of unknown function (DUF397)
MVNSGIDWAGVRFVKSSYSGDDGGNCVEVGWAGVRFVKSSYSSDDGGQCVEVATGAGVVGIRDSKLGAAGPVLALSPAAFTAFLHELKDAHR